jgi:hypothetical protein
MTSGTGALRGCARARHGTGRREPSDRSSAARCRPRRFSQRRPDRSRRAGQEARRRVAPHARALHVRPSRSSLRPWPETRHRLLAPAKLLHPSTSRARTSVRPAVGSRATVDRCRRRRRGSAFAWQHNRDRASHEPIHPLPGAGDAACHPVKRVRQRAKTCSRQLARRRVSLGAVRHVLVRHRTGGAARSVTRISRRALPRARWVQRPVCRPGVHVEATGGCRVWAHRLGLQFRDGATSRQRWTEARIRTTLSAYLAGKGRAAASSPRTASARALGGQPPRQRRSLRGRVRAAEFGLPRVNRYEGRRRYWTDERIERAARAGALTRWLARAHRVLRDGQRRPAAGWTARAAEFGGSEP